MGWDKVASPGSAGRRHDPRAEVLRPFEHWLTGDVLVLAEYADGFCAALSGAAASVIASADGSDLSEATRFDAVVLAGLLPQQSDRGPHRLDDTIAWGRTRLRTGGRMILAIGNALSLNGLARGAEAACLPGFPSLEGRMRPDGFRLPTRKDLHRSLLASGLIHQDWWFPFPDQNRPLSLVSERALAGPGGFDAGALAMAAADLDPYDAGTGLFSLRRAWGPIVDQGLAGDLAPAFVAAASCAPLPDDERLALHLGLRRRPEFERVVTFEAEDVGVRVRRTRLDPSLPAMVEGVSNLFPSEAFVPGASWSAVLDERLARDGWCLDALVPWAEGWRDAIAQTFAAGAVLERDTSLPGPALDAIPKNLVAGRAPTFIDLEWDLGRPLDAGHLAVRGLVNALTDAQAVARPTGPVPSVLDGLRHLLPKLGLALDDAQLTERLTRESRFQSIVSGRATHRDLSWAAATHVPLRTAAACDPEAEIARLRTENEALRAARAADAAAREAAEMEGARRTDRVIAYAADLHRARDRLQEAVDAADAPRKHGDSLPRRFWRALERLT